MDRLNPYETNFQPDIGESRHPLGFLLLLGPPTLCNSIVILTHLSDGIVPVGPYPFLIQLLMMSIGALFPSLVWGVYLATRMAYGSIIRFIVISVVEVVSVVAAWQISMQMFDHWS